MAALAYGGLCCLPTPQTNNFLFKGQFTPHKQMLTKATDTFVGFCLISGLPLFVSDAIILCLFSDLKHWIGICWILKSLRNYVLYSVSCQH